MFKFIKLKFNKKYFFIFSIAIFLLFLSSIMIYASGVWDQGYRIDNETKEVKVSSTEDCHEVTNTSGNSYFIPTKTTAEWDAFANYSPSGVSTGSCPPTCTAGDYYDWSGTCSSFCFGMGGSAFGVGYKHAYQATGCPYAPACTNSHDIFSTGAINYEECDETGCECSGEDIDCTDNTITMCRCSCPCDTSTVTDVDGNIYDTVAIGNQCWMAENLNVGVRTDGLNQINNGITEKSCQADLESNCDIYGGLYQWNEMMQYSTTPGVQGICPTGWHLPTDAEYHTLENHLATGNCDPNRNLTWSCNPAGGALKETGTTHWSSPNIGATDSSSFTALPAGWRVAVGLSYFDKEWCSYWSSSWSVTWEAWYRTLGYNFSAVLRGDGLRTNGLSVRCVKD